MRFRPYILAELKGKIHYIYLSFRSFVTAKYPESRDYAKQIRYLSRIIMHCRISGGIPDICFANSGMTTLQEIKV